MTKYFQNVSFYSNYRNEKWNGEWEGGNDCVVSLRAWWCKLM